MIKTFVNELDDMPIGKRINTVFMISTLSVKSGGRGDFFTGTLSDKTGEVPFAWFTPSKHFMDNSNAIKFVVVAGSIDSYQGKPQIKVSDMEEATTDEYDAEDFFKVAAMSIDELTRSHIALRSRVKDARFVALIDAVMASNVPLRVVSGHDSFQCIQLQDLFYVAPAAKAVHHACRHGLFQHSLEVAHMAADIAEQANTWGYDEPVNVDMVIAGAFLHDIGKVLGYGSMEEGYAVTDIEGLLGHIFVGAEILHTILVRLAFRHAEVNMMMHIVLSHHGKKEYGSPVTPASAEAAIVHHADQLSAMIFMIRDTRAKSKQLWERHPMIEGYVYAGDYSFPEQPLDLALPPDTEDPDACFETVAESIPDGPPTEDDLASFRAQQSLPIDDIFAEN